MSNIISYSISDRNYYQSDVNNATHAQFIEEVNIYYSPKWFTTNKTNKKNHEQLYSLL